MNESPVRYSDTISTFRRVYDDIGDDINSLRSGKLDLGRARVILIARKTQLRTAELALAMQRLYLQYKQEDKAVARKLRKVG